MMDKRKLHVWQPCANILKGRIYYDELTVSDFGLILTLTDQEGTIVDIVYNKGSQIHGDYVWSYRYTNEVPMTVLVPLMEEARKNGKILDSNGPLFYKMTDSDYIEWHDSLGFIPSSEIPNVEHHLIPGPDGVYEFISEYEPKIVVREKRNLSDIESEKLKKTRETLIHEISSLTEEELNWKPSSNQWSIGQVCEHLQLVEDATTKAIFWGLRMNNNVTNRRANIQAALDRTKKIDAPQIVQPSDHQFFVLQHLQFALKESRRRLLKRIYGVEKELLMNRFMRHPVFGDLPLDQWIDLVYLHEQRHIEQIREIKQSFASQDTGKA